MTLSELLNYPIDGRNVAIIGPAASGKTFLSNQLNKGKHKVIHTDVWKDAGYEQAMYLALEEVKNVIGNSIAEGIAMYRMLRKGFEFSNYMPHIVIEIERDKAKRESIYLKERDPAKLKYLQAFEKGNVSVLNSYLSMVGDKKPVWLVWENEN